VAVRADDARDVETLQVSYKPYETGLFGRRANESPPALRGKVSLDVAGATADRAAWALTSASTVSFFIDPWDEKLRASTVTVKAAQAPLSDVVRQVETQLGAERVWYDGAWVFTRKGRRPLFDDLTVKVYNVPGGGAGFWFNHRAGWPANRGAPASSPLRAVERVGERLFVAGTADVHERWENVAERRGPEGRRPGRPARRGKRR
jgi:hypothetical protein